MSSTVHERSSVRRLAPFAAVTAVLAAAFFGPMLVLGQYPSHRWAVAGLSVAVAVLLGASAQRLIARIAMHADEARRREREVARVADVARRLSSVEGTRRDVCAAACEVGDATFALLWEPAGGGRLSTTAAAGVELPRLIVDPARERAAVLTAFRTGVPIFVPDISREPAVNARLLDLSTPVVSVLFQPVLRHGDPVGVLVVGWGERVDRDEQRVPMLVALLAAEAGIAIERADLLRKLEELADTDELTGLPNRRAWNRELDVAISTAERREEPLCVAAIDLDRFKELNDAAGHQAGDRLLKSAAAAWRATLRPADMLARPGGDEFTLVLPDCDVERAGVVLERLRAATPGRTTCSIGVAQWGGAEPPERLLARADEALYAAKEGGRDRVAVAGG